MALWEIKELIWDKKKKNNCPVFDPERKDPLYQQTIEKDSRIAAVGYARSV